jgi:hypothetical protein
MNADARLLRIPFVALAPTDDGYLVYDVAHDRLHRLNPAAALIVELCDGTRTAAALVSDLAPMVSDAPNPRPVFCAATGDAARAI